MTELFYDCGAYGLFTLDTERWQPTYRGKLSSPESFTPDQSAGLDDVAWRNLGPIIKALNGNVHIIDVGGYIGTFTIPLALCAEREGYRPSFDVFEPGPTHDVLAKNIKLNGLSDRVRLHNAAMSSASGETTYRWRGNGSIGGQVFGVFDTTNSKEVRSATIDEVCRGRSGPFLIKLDTQGHENAIMRAGAETIAAKKAIWQIEFLHKYAWDKFNEVNSFAGYLAKEFFVFEGDRQIQQSEMKEFVGSLKAKQYGMTDLLLIPRDASFSGTVSAAVAATGRT